MFSDAGTFLNAIKKRKMMAEAEMKSEAKAPDVEHKIKQCEPQKADAKKLVKKQYKVPKAKPAKEVKQASNVEANVDHKIKQDNKGNLAGGKKNESLDESIFVLAGIEEILTNEDKKAGALGAADIIASYMGGKIDPQYQDFISMFKNVLGRK